MTEAARILGYNRRTIIRAIKAQRLPAERLGDRGWWKIPRAALKRRAA